MYDLEHILVSELTRCPIQLRPVAKNTLSYTQLKDSLHKNGLWQPLLVRPKDGRKEVVDGNNRFEIALDLDWDLVPCMVREIPDDWVLRAQIQANQNNIITKPGEYASRIWQIVRLERSHSIEDVAHELCVSSDWVRRMMGLVNLCPAGKEAMQSGKLTLSHGIELSKLPMQDQERLLVMNGTLTHQEYVEVIREVARGYRQGLKDARTVRNLQAEPGVRFRTMKEVEDELANSTVAGSVISACGAETKSECFRAGIEWIVQTDPLSLKKRLERREKKRQKDSDNDFIRKTKLEVRRLEYVKQKDSIDGGLTDEPSNDRSSG